MMGEALGAFATSSQRDLHNRARRGDDHFVLAKKLRLVAAEIYASLSQKLRGDPELRVLFTLVASEKQRRAQRSHGATETYRERGNDNVGKMVPLRLRLLLVQMKTCLKNLLRAPNTSADCALELARLVEEGLAMTRAEALVGNDEPALLAKLRAIEAEDRAHAALESRLAAPQKNDQNNETDSVQSDEAWLLADLTAAHAALR